MNLVNPVAAAGTAALSAPPPIPRLPPHATGMRIGLFGGTFNPPHDGHRLVSLIALRRLGLDRIWWLVTPGNPLKQNASLPPLDVRMEACRRLTRHPRIIISGLEAEIGTRYTYDTIAYLRQRCAGVDFVWIMGADNLANFHRWQRWRDIADLVPIAVIDRPGSTLKASHSRAASVFSRRRFDESEGYLLVGAATPAFMFLHGPRSDLSSTVLRENGRSLAPAAAQSPTTSIGVGLSPPTQR